MTYFDHPCLDGTSLARRSRLLRGPATQLPAQQPEYADHGGAGGGLAAAFRRTELQGVARARIRQRADGALDDRPRRHSQDSEYGKVPLPAARRPATLARRRPDDRRLKFANFELSFEWKVATGANSGVKYNVSEAYSLKYQPGHAALGFEYQIEDDSLGDDIVKGTHRAAALYELIAANALK